MPALLGAGAEVNEHDTRYEMTALMWAAHHGHRECVRLLLERSDVDINRRCHRGMTALMLAAEKGWGDERAKKGAGERRVGDARSKDSLMKMFLFATALRCC